MATVKQLGELQHGQSADFFAQLIKKDSATTRQGRPFFAVEFRDNRRNATSAIWEGSSHELACRDEWKVGQFYKIRGTFQETAYGAKIEILRIRAVEEADTDSGFNPLLCQPVAENDSGEMFDHLLDLVEREITTEDLKSLIIAIFEQNRERLESLPGAVHHHHAYAGGYLEHVYSVTRNVLYLIEMYRGQHPSLRDPLTQELALAGALLHDIGKLRELDEDAGNTAYTVAGELIGHIALGRDIIRDMAKELEIDAPWLVRLEHLIVSHQGTPQHGSPKSPMTWEANLVYWADELDGNIYRLAQTFEQAETNDVVIPNRNPFGRRVFRGELPLESESSA